MNILRLLSIVSVFFVAISQSHGDSNSSFPYQCRIIPIPVNQIPSTECNFQVYLQSYIGPRPTPTTFWNYQVAYGVNSEFRACDAARNFAGQQCVQVAWQWYGGRAACYDQFYQCTTYLPVPR